MPSEHALPSRRTFGRRAVGLGAAAGAGAVAVAATQWSADADTAGSTYAVNVRDHGAKGDGKTDDSDAIRAAVTAAIAGRVGGAAQKEVYFPPGNYKVTKKDTLMWSPTGGSADQIFGLRFRGAGPRVTNIDFATTFGANPDPRENNLITAAVRLRYTYFLDMSFRSTNPNNRFAYLWSRDGDDTALHYPQYGVGQNQYFVYQNVEWRGVWDRVIGLDGDKQANNNSEHHFLMCSTDTQSRYTDAFLHCGITNPGANSQQNQFLNYFMMSCNFALAGGDFFRFDRGGSINVLGGSWSMVGTDPARYFYMPLGNGDITATRLNVNGVRFEPKQSPDQRIIDCGWGNGNVTFTSCSDIAAVQVPGAANYNLHRYTGTQNRIPIVRYQDCILAGYHLVDNPGAALSKGKMIYEGCRFYHSNQALGPASGTSFLRYTGPTGRYAFRDSWDTADISG
ncbi:glycoside hydrolase family 55 protein [Yinghuangia soli]|uniref:Glycoside hydrolase family 55 protein n=1 Tax=Yinghuangia soli TaxID=2908204 RepID=A0AA41Q8I8_9ACTN|nr:glycoside hydrolase family 55 protein [Yinghuangia soli]MCF2528908.1 glycoside hydrolase family 55 protein [Yinghuangia soli]MCF2533560.1 glycoside hydrolase family 55 protein [Yinghuangia soli]